MAVYPFYMYNESYEPQQYELRFLAVDREQAIRQFIRYEDDSCFTQYVIQDCEQWIKVVDKDGDVLYWRSGDSL